nr:opioid-binding protein/cell adhesion molecule homolog [Bactrocera oleae]
MTSIRATCFTKLFRQPAGSLLFVLIFMCHKTDFSLIETAADVITDPKFSFPIVNVTASVGREAFLTCVVQDLGSFKVAWLRVDTQTILTIQNHVITKNQRIGITNSEHKTWTMKIKDIKESDKGWYMCQINTDPMKSQMGYLDVVVPPDILDYPTSTDMVVREDSNVTLKCAATGSPEPTITWRRENGVPIELANGSEALRCNFDFARVKRQHMGAYLCIASNGVPPSVSKRITFIVHCVKYTSGVTEIGEYRNSMQLHISDLTQAEFGAYRCVAKNSLGDTDGTIKLYRIPPTAVNYVENSEGRYKGNNKKRIKSSELYHQSKASDGGSVDMENPGKRKDMMLGNELDDGFYDSAAAAVTYCQQHKLTVTTMALFTMLLLFRKVAVLIDV